LVYQKTLHWPENEAVSYVSGVALLPDDIHSIYVKWDEKMENFICMA
jgi:hypothetical protein